MNADATDPMTKCAECETCPLNCLTQGCCASVVSVGGDRELRRRLLELGFCNGALVQLVRRAPFGDPIEFRLRGYHLSLRSEQAQNVVVRVVA
jgi:ferrous iron transport protein A